MSIGLRRSKIPQYWGTATLARQWWCHQFFIFKARKEEESYKTAIEQMRRWGFGPGEVLDIGLESKDFVHLRGEELRTMELSDVQDRLAVVGFQLGEWPTDLEKVEGLSLLGPWPLYPSDVQDVRCLSEEHYLANREVVAQYDYTVWADGTVSETPASTSRAAKMVQTVKNVASEVTEAMAEGVIAENRSAEVHRRASGYFAWRDYLVMSVPDGLGEDFAYEFKTSGVAYYVLPVARAQANLYAYFYKKPRIRVQILDKKTDQVRTYEEPADFAAAEALLERAEMLLKGDMQPIPPKRWKCRVCEFATECPIAQGEAE